MIVVGGEHATALPEVVLAQAAEVDLVVVGEGEATLVEVVAARRDRASLAGLPGAVVRHTASVGSSHQPRARIRPIDALPLPAWDLVPLEAYLERHHGFGVHRGRSMPIVATRGCPYECTFCSNPGMWTTRWTPREPAAVLEEILGFGRLLAVR